ncbi:MAG: hypothetical protein JWO89_2666 [Verrucomicrobiaceae bacterium]|nr:hypothetical protein [Verrucomicrobiaceae bacterium]
MTRVHSGTQCKLQGLMPAPLRNAVPSLLPLSGNARAHHACHPPGDPTCRFYRHSNYLIHNMKTILTLLAAMTLATTSGFAETSGKKCCKEGAACCKEGKDCCKEEKPTEKK